MHWGALFRQPAQKNSYEKPSLHGRNIASSQRKEISEMYDLILKNGSVVTPGGIVKTDIAVKNGRIAGLGDFSSAKKIIDCKNLHILPGVIDTHVHFREPGLTHKEDLATGTLSAIAGGVTTIFDMPNTDPPTITAETLQDKMTRAKGRAWCDYAFFIGGSPQNVASLATLEMMPGCPGVKIFMGSAKGDLLVAEDSVFLSLLKNGTRLVALHAEDEPRAKERRHIAEESHNAGDHPVWRDEEMALMATKRAVRLAREAGRRIHVLHVTSAEEIAFLQDHKDIATIEVTPHHLTLFAPDCYDRLGAYATTNPPIRDKRHQDALWEAVRNGLVDVLGSGHPPHTREEKDKPYPDAPNGVPGVQTTLPIMLDHVNKGHLTLEHLVDLLSHNPQRLFQIARKGRIAVGYDADFAIVDLNKTQTITNKWIKSKCGWTPYDGIKVTGWVEGTVLGGDLVMWKDNILGSPKGKSVVFAETLRSSAETALPSSNPLQKQGLQNSI
ncbi:MAG: dihydroorotase [Pseudomonadota bacterium]